MKATTKKQRRAATKVVKAGWSMMTKKEKSNYYNRDTDGTPRKVGVKNFWIQKFAASKGKDKMRVIHFLSFFYPSADWYLKGTEEV